MLVITRRTGESLVAYGRNGEEIKLTVVKSGDDRVTLGVEAPRDIAVVREELIPVDS